MYNLPAATFLTAEPVRRQFDVDEEPVAPDPQPVRRTRLAVADALERLAVAVRPAADRCAGHARGVLPSGAWEG